MGELLRLNARNAFGFGARPSPSACIDSVPPALAPPGQSEQSDRSWPPASLLGAPTARGNALLSSWEICRLQSLLPGVSIKCSGPCSQVLDIALGSHSVADVTVASLAPRLTRLLVALAQATSSRPDQLLNLIHGGFRPCLTLARTAAESRETFECFLPLGIALSDPRPRQLCVYYGSYRAGDNHAGVGVCLFPAVGSQPYEVYRYQFYLGQTCTVLFAGFQGAYLAPLHNHTVPPDLGGPSSADSSIIAVFHSSHLFFLLSTRASPAQFTARSPTDLGQMTPDYCILVECRLQGLRWKRTSLYPGRPSR